MEKYIGKYKILEEIGRGGMGIVYKGEDVKLGRTVAIKTIAAQLAFDRRSIENFLKEAKILAKLQHPNIVLIYDFVEEEDTAFLIMEYIQGETVTARLDREGHFPVGQAAKIVNNVASALDHAHAQGIIHRDIKPENVMITKEGVVKVTDFGIAKLTMGTRTTLTQFTPGTPCYMSPEQAIGGKVIDKRSDIYSLGILFYEMVTGTLPFDNDSEYLVRDRHINTPPVPPSNILPGLSPAYEKIILKCLAKNKTDRFQNANDLIEAINNADESAGNGPNIVVRMTQWVAAGYKLILAAALVISVVGAGSIILYNYIVNGNNQNGTTSVCKVPIDPDDPVGFVCAYFQDCQNGDVDAAVKKRSDLSLENVDLLRSEIQNSEFYKISDISLLESSGSTAEIFTKYTYKRKGQTPISYAGSFLLNRNKFGRWEIVSKPETSIPLSGQ